MAKDARLKDNVGVRFRTGERGEIERAARRVGALKITGQPNISEFIREAALERAREINAEAAATRAAAATA